ncbi:1,2-phenylacetyl-CoA epoxidase subunit PaaC [Prauserella muralis]|uniref:Phenylacetate-CoA oxygenase subunit PaaI n=1 Tax=Prauserella muralis TaxID=588067 RepID=A0A2V4B763_9PSEU|nr:1,2-phenylacetyl-CoA epoxidase subunit PaaC [Prauserella muralis]PXY31067.1 phenylacetate-CoA oxygenase subunit PaaI [Prauserella muralis]TWE14653.1 ring-1,2-phenylacetyl-CoA epoxidase subunit PaaC [Prauserella muralis]
MVFDNAYEAITEENDSRWAFGTGFTDPLEGVDTSVPSGVDAGELEAYCLMLGDDALVFSHRLQEWCTNAPELEDEVAIANIALDLLGQARLLLARAGERGEDSYAFFRGEHEFRNVRLAELPHGDFGELIAALLVFSTWRLALLRRLTESRDPVLAAIAAKGVKEVTYHRDYAAQWTVRLGDGTDHSRERMAAGLATGWPYVDELFTPHEIEVSLAASGVAVNPAESRAEFDEVLAQVLRAATLDVPEVPGIPGVSGRTGRDGVHTESMGYLLAELQSVARADPEATW